MKKTLLILLALVALTSVSAQQSLNDYKYIIVPNKYEFLNNADQYKLNSLTVFLFNKNGFEALMEGETLPSDLANNTCYALTADVLKDSNMFKTKLSVQLKNCKNEIIFTSILGESREKNYKVAYNQALRNAFKSFETANYSYNSKNTLSTNNEIELVENKQEEINNLKEEIETLKEENVVAVKQQKTEKQAVKEIVSISSTLKNTKILDVLYAQKTTDGFQLVDKTSKVIYKIKKTGLSNVFLVEGKNAIIYQLDANWILEYYENKKPQTKILNIKF